MSQKMIWFDFGGVLSPPLANLFESYHERTGIEPGLLKWAIAEVAHDLGQEPLAPIELGLLTEVEWMESIHGHLGRRRPDLDLSRSEPAFGAQWFEGHVVNSVLRHAAVELSLAGFKVGILTNNVVEWEPHWKQMVDLEGVVDDVVDSCKVNMRKPDPAIFALAASRNAVDMADCVLIDDLAENCAAARAEGWAAIQHIDNVTTVARLGELVAPEAQLSLSM
ncbi:MAG: HAD-IA family hydrolase [Nocardioides sp.]|uniref:HAD-IA family hydrolase n=1 Tax=Nocardioides sp. TaxID=35761 RepID=UPI003D6C647B